MFQFNRMYIYRYCDLRKIPTHSHNAHEIVYYERGSGITNIGENCFFYEPNTFTVTPKGLKMNETHQSSTTPWCIMINTDEPLVPQILKDTADKRIFGFFKKIREEQYRTQKNKQQALDAYCTLMMIEIMRMTETDYEPRNLFGKVISEIEYNLLQPIDLKHLADMTNYSYEHFRHMFKRFYGISPQKYIINQRLRHAMRLLKEQPNYTATYISEICQFPNYNQFRIHFEQETGMSPAAYRLQFKQNK